MMNETNQSQTTSTTEKVTKISFEGREIEITNAQPPLWRWIHEAFPEASLDKQIFAFGKRIYWANQVSNPLPLETIHHEFTHLKQQGFSFMGAVKWWRRYANDKVFRMDQEIEACQAAWKYANTALNAAKWSDGQKLTAYLNTMARNLSSEVYGNAITFEEAKRRISGAAPSSIKYSE